VNERDIYDIPWLDPWLNFIDPDLRHTLALIAFVILCYLALRGLVKMIKEAAENHEWPFS
jgi:hypothetical protein